ncbi:MAG: GFA family protein [Polyangiaceae bacterium]
MSREEHDPTQARPEDAQHTLHGSCLCKSFRFELRGPVRFLKNCHCSRCRKMTGGAFATYARARADALHVLSGRDALTLYERQPGNFIAFCRICGSLVPYPPPGSLEVEFLAGLLDDDPGLKVSFEIYVGSRASWSRLDEGVPQFDEQTTGAASRVPGT